MRMSSFVPRLALLLLMAAAASAQAVRVEGVVHDSSGAAVAGAQVTIQAGSYSASHASDGQGSFAFDAVPASSGRVIVKASGFSELQQEWATSGPVVELSPTLTPAPVNEEVLVTATRTESRLGDLAISAVALNHRDINGTPALLTDDKLRQIPGFTLFRRTSSRTANPTTLGVSLSGLGASGASRALVLEDGVPLNDPFGGWVYWGRVPQQGLESIELVRRGISNLYGSDGLAGAIQFIPKLEEGPAFSLETSYGNEQTPDLSIWGGTRAGAWDAALSTDLFHTDGYIPVPVPERGSVDTVANSEHAAVEVTLGRNFGQHDRVFGRGSFFTESRQNGTLIQNNDTRLAQGVLGANTQSDSLGWFSARLFGQAQGYNQSFSAVPIPGNPGRDSEALTNLQHVPAQQAGASAWWSKPFGRQVLVAGFDANQVMGWSNEQVFSAVSGLNTADTVAGGRQRTVGVYGQDIVRITPKWILTLGGRLDRWRNYDAQLVRTPINPGGPTTATPFDERSENAFSPRASLLHQLTSNVSVTVSAYRSFRAPTLNELYRSFRVGNVLTSSNPDLEAERLTGAEAGANIFAFDRKLNLRGNFFWNDIVDPIANVTLDQNSSPILRQRQNLGRTRSRGVEVDAVARLRSTVEISGGYQFVDATVLSFPADPAQNPIPLEGKLIPQVPRHQFTLQARYWNPSRLMVSVQGRFVGNQFDDDINTFLLDRYFAVDLLIGRSLGHGIDVFGAAENMFNTRYVVALTPTPNLGAPVLARVGIRFNFPSR
ncbi:MAG TPA: TonB-dependent receptor [Terriglobales bacterium]